MFSQSDVQKINREAAKNEKKLVRAARTLKLNGKPLTCEGDFSDFLGICDATDQCSGPLTANLWYDVFSDKPKGILTFCEHHDNGRWVPWTGFFVCDDCGRFMASYYHGELYRVLYDDHLLCLPCAGKRYIPDDNNWIALRDEDIAVVNESVVRRIRHVLATHMPVPKEIELFRNIELKPAKRLPGFSFRQNTPVGGVQEIRELLTEAKHAGHERALLIIDADRGLLSVGVYVPAQSRRGAAEGEQTNAR